ncbi:MAG: hypothetical protein FWE16_03570 [Firmicutes bacterium]|nr:hypothetical protein [Bacillota bacterium]
MKKILTLSLVLALMVTPMILLSGCNRDCDDKECFQPTLSMAIFREQRAPSLAFYAPGSGPVSHDEEGVRGHFGTQAANAVTVNNSTHTVTVNASTYATQVAVNVRRMFPMFDNLTNLRIRTAAVGQTAAGDWVYLRTTADNATTNTGNFHVYTTNDNGWVTTGNHMPAYFVVNTPAAQASRTIEVGGTYDDCDFTFFVTINRA